MKTLKIIAILLLISGFACQNAFCQKPVTVVLDVYAVLPFDCMGQNLEGTLTAERTYMNNHLQSHVYGTMTGSSDGLTYYIEMINNIAFTDNWDEYGQKAITQTFPGNYHISRDGKLIAIIHFAYHYTFNANGELISFHGNHYECNLVGEGKFK